MSDHLSGIDVFVQTVQAGSFSRAAEQLHLSRSAVGKTIARLEERLHTRLFHRTTRRQMLTEDGQLFYEHCLRALTELEQGEKRLDQARTELSGRLRITLPVLYGRRIVAPILMRLAQKHPQLDMELYFNDQVIDLIDNGFDLAIRNGALPDSTTLRARRVAQQSMTVCAAPDWLQQHGTPQTLEDLRQCAGIRYRRNDFLLPWQFPGTAGTLKTIQPHASMQLNDMESAMDAVTLGLAVGWLPNWLIRDRVNNGSLVTLLSHETPLTFDIHLVWPAVEPLPLRVRLVIDTLAKQLPGQTA